MGSKDDKSYMAMGARSPRESDELQWVTVGFEQVLFIAAREPAFLKALLKDRTEAVEKRGLQLTDAERSVLFAVSDAQLRAMIERIDISDATSKQSGFMQKVAATVVTLAAGTTLVACDSPGVEMSKGARPDMNLTPSPPAVDPEDPLSPPKSPVNAERTRLDTATDSPSPPLNSAENPTVEMTPETTGHGIRPEIPSEKTQPAEKTKIPIKPERRPTRGHIKR